MRGAVFPAILAAAMAIAPAEADAFEGRWISEFKAGLLKHDISFLGSNREDGLDLNTEVLFVSPELLQPLYGPRPHVGLSVNTAGDTSQIYAGLTWTAHFADRRLFAAFGAGGALHDGRIDETREDKGLGSRILFRLSAEAGYELNERWNLSLYYSHISNANLGSNNEGLNNLGIRIGYKLN